MTLGNFLFDSTGNPLKKNYNTLFIPNVRKSKDQPRKN